MQSNDDSTHSTLSAQDAVRQKIADIAPVKGTVYLDILDAYSERPEEINDELPNQRALGREVSSFRAISIDEVADEYEIEQSPENIDQLARAVIYEHFTHEEPLREVALGESDVDKMVDASKEFLILLAETMQEMAPYEYRDTKESINKTIQNATPRSQLR